MHLQVEKHPNMTYHKSSTAQSINVEQLTRRLRREVIQGRHAQILARIFSVGTDRSWDLVKEHPARSKHKLTNSDIPKFGFADEVVCDLPEDGLWGSWRCNPAGVLQPQQPAEVWQGILDRHWRGLQELHVRRDACVLVTETSDKFRRLDICYPPVVTCPVPGGIMVDLRAPAVEWQTPIGPRRR